ncbi:MAG: YesL family protein [Oscillospiraceae bacterium]|nr:YesL family protein [Oscillospiraceae bacterium]
MACCLPVVTIIPSCVALYDCTVACIHGDEEGVCRRFFSTFKTVLLRGIGLSVLWLAVAAVLVTSFIFLNEMAKGNGFLQIYTTIYAGTMLIPLALLAWLIPLESRFVQGFWAVNKTALSFSLIHLPTTGALLGILAVGVLCIMTLPVLILVVPAIIVTIQSHLTEKVFDREVAKNN